MTPSTQDALTRQISALRRLESLGFSDDCPGGIAVGGSLVPLQGTVYRGDPVSQGIGRRWLTQPWALFFRPVRPMDDAPNGGACRDWNGRDLVRPVRPLDDAPNGGREPSPGLSVAIPWDSGHPRNQRPEWAREPDT